MELLIETIKNKGKVIDNYLFNLKFTVSKKALKVLWHVALICTIYCIADMICTAAFRESFSQLCQADHKKQFNKEVSNSKYEISKTKDNFLTATVIIFSINNKTRCTYFKPWCQVVPKDQTYFKNTAKNYCLF